MNNDIPMQRTRNKGLLYSPPLLRCVFATLRATVLRCCTDNLASMNETMSKRQASVPILSPKSLKAGAATALRPWRRSWRATALPPSEPQYSSTLKAEGAAQPGTGDERNRKRKREQNNANI